MMVFDDNLRKIIDSVSRKYPADIDRAVKEAAKRFWSLGNAQELLPALVEYALRGYIHDHRHHVNYRIKRRRKQEDPERAKPKVLSTKSKTAGRIHQAVTIYYDYRVNGTVLGNLTGQQLRDLAPKLRHIATGHVFNAQLVEKLAVMVPPESKVRESISNRKLGHIFRELEKSLDMSPAM